MGFQTQFWQEGVDTLHLESSHKIGAPNPWHEPLPPHRIGDSTTYGQTATMQHLFPDALQWKENDMGSWWGHTSSQGPKCSAEWWGGRKWGKEARHKECKLCASISEKFKTRSNLPVTETSESWLSLAGDEGREGDSLYLITGEGYIGRSIYQNHAIYCL